MNGKSTETEPLLPAIATSLEEDGASWAVIGASPDAHNWVLCVGHKTFFLHPMQFFGKHHSIPIHEWGEDSHDFPQLENFSTDLHHDIMTQTGLPLNIEIVAYVGELGSAQHWQRDFLRKVIPEGHHAFAVFFPLNYQLNGNQWIHGSFVGFPVPWVVWEMDAGLADTFVLNVCSIRGGGGLPEGVPPVDEISQRRNIRWVGFMLLSATALPKNVTQGINPPFWAEDPSMTLDAPDVAHCGVKSCRKRPTSTCYESNFLPMDGNFSLKIGVPWSGSRVATSICNLKNVALKVARKTQCSKRTRFESDSLNPSHSGHSIRLSSEPKSGSALCNGHATTVTAV